MKREEMIISALVDLVNAKEAKTVVLEAKIKEFEAKIIELEDILDTNIDTREKYRLLKMLNKHLNK